MANGKYNAQNQSHVVETTLDLLDAVAEDENASQRGLANRIGVALGLTNAVLKRCVKKGLLKVRQAPARRYAYYLTPRGFAEKSRLTAEYLGYSLKFYRDARQQYSELFAYCEKRNWRQVVLVAATELTEIASLACSDAGVEVIGILDTDRNEPTFCGLPVYRSLSEIPRENRAHAVVLGDITDPQAAYDLLAKEMPPERILAPSILRVLATGKVSGADMEESKE